MNGTSTIGGAAIRVLSVEEDIDFERLIGAWLDRDTLHHFEVTPAGQLSDVAGELDADGFDVMLLDLDDPDRRGLDTLTSARELASDLPIVVITAAADRAIGERAIESGADDFLVKGAFGPDTLSATLVAAVDSRRGPELAGSQGSLRFEDRAELLSAFERSQNDPWVGSAIVDLPNQLLSLRVAQGITSDGAARGEWFDRFRRISGGRF